MSDSHTWSENCVLCGGTCHLGKGKSKASKADDAPTTKPDGAAKPKRTKKAKSK